MVVLVLQAVIEQKARLMAERRQSRLTGTNSELGSTKTGYAREGEYSLQMLSFR